MSEVLAFIVTLIVFEEPTAKFPKIEPDQLTHSGLAAEVVVRVTAVPAAKVVPAGLAAMVPLPVVLVESL